MNQKPKILIFLEEGILAESYYLEFIKVGFDVKIYQDYANLLVTVFKENPDAIFCGTIASGEINGVEALQTLRNNEKIKRIPIITPINLQKEEDVRASLDLGEKRFYIKEEYNPQKVAKEVKEYLIQTGRFTNKDFK